MAPPSEPGPGAAVPLVPAWPLQETHPCTPLKRLSPRVLLPPHLPPRIQGSNCSSSRCLQSPGPELQHRKNSAHLLAGFLTPAPMTMNPFSQEPHWPFKRTELVVLTASHHHYSGDQPPREFDEAEP